MFQVLYCTVTVPERVNAARPRQDNGLKPLCVWFAEVAA